MKHLNFFKLQLPVLATFVFAFNAFLLSAQYQCTPVLDMACTTCGNHIPNGSFESFTNDPGTDYFEINNCDGSVNVCGWAAIEGSPDILPNGSLGTNGTYVPCGSFPSDQGLACLRMFAGESVATSLVVPLVGGQNYHLQFAIRTCTTPGYLLSAKFFISNTPLNLTLPVIDNSYVYDPLTSWDFAYIETEEGVDFGPIYSSAYDNYWHTITVAFECPMSMDGATILGILPLSGGQVFIDDMHLIKDIPDLPVLELPEEPLLCNATIIEHLENYITLLVPNAPYTITGPGVVDIGGGFYNFDASLLPPGFYDLIGVTITLSTLNVWGCPVSVIDVVESCCQLYAQETISTDICDGTLSFNLSVAIDGSIGTYSYSWTGPDVSGSNALSFQNLQPGDYDILITDPGFPNCMVSETYTISAYINTEAPPTYFVDANTPDWVGQNYMLLDDLVVLEGVNFVIDNCGLKFAYGKGIILQFGADLHIKNNSKLSTLYDCTTGFWSGIYAEHSSDYPYEVDRSYVGIDDSTIGNAEVAVEFRTLTSANPNPDHLWQYFYSKRSHYINNKQDVVTKGQAIWWVPGPMTVRFLDCEFLLNENFLSTLTPASTRVFIEESATVMFTNCQFINSIPAFLQGAQELTAIRSQYSRILFVGMGLADDGFSKSRISGFARGIHGWSNMGIGYSTIKASDFFCWRDVYLGVMNNSLIRNNGFHSLPPEMYNSLSGIMTLNNTLQNI